MLLTVFEMLKTDFLRLAKFNSLPIVTFVGNPETCGRHIERPSPSVSHLNWGKKRFCRPYLLDLSSKSAFLLSMDKKRVTLSKAESLVCDVLIG